MREHPFFQMLLCESQSCSLSHMCVHSFVLHECWCEKESKNRSEKDCKIVKEKHKLKQNGSQAIEL